MISNRFCKFIGGDNRMRKQFEEQLFKLISEILEDTNLKPDNISYSQSDVESGEKSSSKESQSLYFVEMAYPPDLSLASQEIAKKPIFRVEYYKNYINIVIPSYKFNENDVPVTFKLPPKLSTLKYIPLQLLKVDETAIEYFRALILSDYKHYTSSGNNFGCCSSFNECSDKKTCVHSNLLYAKKCIYRTNLDQGKIFYGPNRNA